MPKGVALISFAGKGGSFTAAQDPDNPQPHEIYDVPEGTDYVANGLMRLVKVPLEKGAPPPPSAWHAPDGSRFDTLKEARRAGWKRADLDKT